MSSPVPAPAREYSCLLVEDDAGFAQMLTTVVRETGGDALHCGNLREARAALGRRSFDVIVLDNHLPDGKGFDFYFELAKRNPAQTAILLTGLPELAHAVELTRHGLFDYLSKPIDADAFAACLRRARTRLAHLKTGLPPGEMVVVSPAMREVAQLLQQAARHPAATVLLTGETGVGKDVAAQALHQWTFASQAATTPYVAVNCASMPAEMFEAELFGSERGAYTGAEKAREGLAGATKDGTLFLDEIGEVPLPLQAKLLRFLEAREYRSLGSTVTKKFAGRVVAATNRSLPDEVAAGRFRQDLLYRLDSFTVHLPPPTRTARGNPRPGGTAAQPACREIRPEGAQAPARRWRVPAPLRIPRQHPRTAQPARTVAPAHSARRCLAGPRRGLAQAGSPRGLGNARGRTASRSRARHLASCRAD